MVLSGIKVIELANVLAGPSVGSFLAELGASVIKVENQRSNGDVTRTWKLPNEDPESRVSAYFSSVNYHKSYLLANLRSEDDFKRVTDLIRESDILISSYKAGDAEKLGMDYASLSKTNPRLIYASINGFGLADPRPAYDVVIQAEAGFMSMNGEAGGPPLKMPVALMDILAAHQLKEAILLALLHREKTGEGSELSASLFESAVCSLANQAGNYLMGGKIAGRMGSMHPNIAPYGEVFKCKDDKEVVLAIGNDKHFTEMCTLLGCPEMAIRAEFKNNTVRLQNRSLMQELLIPYFKKWPRAQLLEEMERKAIPAGAIKDLAELFENEVAKSLIRDEMIEDTETKRVSQIAFRTSFT